MRILLAALAAAALAAAPAAAATYDAFASFTGTHTGGAFTYGVVDDTLASPTFTPYSDVASNCANRISNVVCTSNGDLPAAYKTTSGAHQSGTVLVPGNALLLHPGPNAGETSAVVFTAPTTGRYKLAFSSFVTDIRPSGVIIEGFAPGFAIVPLATLTAANPTYALPAATGVLAAGQQFGFAVNYDGNYFNDSTGINFTLTTVPEPAAWALMIAGFCLVGGAARRRRTAVAA